MGDVVEDVITIIAEKAQIDRGKVVLSAKLTELHIASLDVVEIIFAIEEKFGIEVPFNANSPQLEFETVGAVVQAVEKLLAERDAT